MLDGDDYRAADQVVSDVGHDPDVAVRCVHRHRGRQATDASQKRLSSYTEIAGSTTLAQRVIDRLHVPMTGDELVGPTNVTNKRETNQGGGRRSGLGTPAASVKT